MANRVKPLIDSLHMMPAIKFGVRFMLVCAVLVLLLHRYGEILVKPLLPVYQWEVSELADEYQIRSFGLDNQNGDRVVHLQVTLAKPIFIGDHLRLPDERGLANATTTISHLWQMVIVCCAGLLAWPASRTQNYLFRFAIAVPLLILLSMIDTPLALLASIWELLVQQVAPDTFSPLILWNNFLEDGGRLALGLFTGAISICAANLIAG